MVSQQYSILTKAAGAHSEPLHWLRRLEHRLKQAEIKR